MADSDDDTSINRTRPSVHGRYHYRGPHEKNAITSVDGKRIFWTSYYGGYYYNNREENREPRILLKWWAQGDMVRAEGELLEDQDEHSIVLDRCSFSQESKTTQIPWRKFVEIVVQLSLLLLLLV